jgi:hypothetical protein
MFHGRREGSEFIAEGECELLAASSLHTKRFLEELGVLRRAKGKDGTLRSGVAELSA